LSLRRNLVPQCSHLTVSLLMEASLIDARYEISLDASIWPQVRASRVYG
jgi:hypothetical protein